MTPGRAVPVLTTVGPHRARPPATGKKAPVSPTAPAPDDPAEQPAGNPFADLADFVALPRLGALALSPDGARLAVSLQTLDPQRKKWQSAVWEIDPAGSRPARRVDRAAPGGAGPSGGA